MIHSSFCSRHDRGNSRKSAIAVRRLKPMRVGWSLTHGVGAMRKYCIGAVLLDLDDPLKVIGRLKEPLLGTDGRSIDGYVPNVVYSCGALIHGGQLVLPYGLNDSATTIVTIELKSLLAALDSIVGQCPVSVP